MVRQSLFPPGSSWTVVDAEPSHLSLFSAPGVRRSDRDFVNGFYPATGHAFQVFALRGRISFEFLIAKSLEFIVEVIVDDLWLIGIGNIENGFNGKILSLFKVGKGDAL